MENEKDRDAIVTMCLTGYRDTIKKLTYALITIAVCWLCTVGGVLMVLVGVRSAS